MRKLAPPSGRIRFALSRIQHESLSRVIATLSETVVDGMHFTTALSPWREALAAATSPDALVVMQPKHTAAHGDEVIITADPAAMRPVIDALALIVDADRPEVAALRTLPAEGWLRLWREWYGLETLYRSEMRQRYTAPTAAA